MARPRLLPNTTQIWLSSAIVLLWVVGSMLGGPLKADASEPQPTAIASASGKGAPEAPPSHGNVLELIMIDVGQGDGILIRSPGGKVVLLDAGPRGARASVGQTLEALGITEIDLAMGSHPHEDHIGSMTHVFDKMPVARYIDPGFAHTSATYQNLLKSLETHEIPYGEARRGQKIDLKGGAWLTILGPEDPMLSGTRSDANSNSIIARLTFGDFSALLTGDAEYGTEQRLLSHESERRQLQATVLKVAHHGGRHSTYADFLDAVAPSLALISVGEGNSYSHPGVITLKKLKTRNIETFRTDELGAIRLTTDGHWIWVEALSAPATGLRPDSPLVMHATPLGVFPAAGRQDTKVASLPVSKNGQKARAKKPQAIAKSKVEARARINQAVDTSSEFAASRSSKVFHQANCGNAGRISPTNLRTYTNREAAISDGKRPAQCCQP